MLLSLIFEILLKFTCIKPSGHPGNSPDSVRLASVASDSPSTTPSSNLPTENPSKIIWKENKKKIYFKYTKSNFKFENECLHYDLYTFEGKTFFFFNRKVGAWEIFIKL